jgi:hypothetical protein
MMQAASDELLKRPTPPPTHIPLRELWDCSNYEIELTSAQMNHLEICEDCLTVLDLCRIEKSFMDVERIVEKGGFFQDGELAE